MRQVYSPGNAPEAHMLAHLLGQAGITAHIHGEALQLAAGELPVTGALQIMVADEDYEEARRLLLTWEKQEAAPEEREKKRRFSRGALGLVVLGVAIGWLTKSFLELSHFTITDHTTQEDRNGDGRPDSTWFYAPGSRHAFKGEFDHNHDGAVDNRVFYDATGTVVEADDDADFSGSFETKEYYHDGVIVRSEIDNDGDGRPDVKNFYVSGTPAWSETTDPRTGAVVRVDTYENLRLVSADLDLDRDGFRETRRYFDRFGEITRTERIAR